MYGLLRTLAHAFVYGAVFTIIRSPFLMLLLGVFVGFFFALHFPVKAAAIWTSIPLPVQNFFEYFLSNSQNI